MFRFRTLRSKAAATIAAALALLASGTAAAQAGGYTPSEEDAILLQLQVRGYRLANDLRGYQTPGGACVDLADVIQSLDLPIRLDRKSRRATGWIFAEDQTFSLDRDSNTVQIMNRARAIQPGELHDTPEGWCIDTRTLGGWLGVSLTANLRNSTLLLESDRPLPFIEAIERQSRAARLRPERAAQDLSGYPQAKQPYAMWRMPSVDVVAQSDYRSASGPQGGRLNTRYEIFASGEVARASVDVRLASDHRGVPDSLRMRAYRKDPDGGMLGPLRATQLIAGDVDMLSGNLAGAPGVGRGMFVSNRALHQSDRFGRTVLRGSLPLGWDAELYRNGQLLAFQGTTSDGRYEFEVNLVFGANDLEVVLYGPQGQIRRESQSIPIGHGTLPAGKIEYWVGVIERNHDLISFGRPPPSARFDDGWQFAAGMQYGLDRRTVLGANAHSLFIDRRRRDYAELNVQRSFGSMLLNLTAAQERGRGRAYRADLLGQFGKFNVQAQSFFVDGGFTSGLVGENEKSAHSLTVDTLVDLGRRPLSLSGGVRRTTQRNGREVNEALARASLLLPRLSLTGFVHYRDTEGIADPEDGTRVGMLANTRFLGLTARGEASYRITGPRKGFDSANLTLERALSDRSDLRFEVEHSQWRGRTEFDLAYVRHFRQVAVRAGAQADTDGGIGVSLGASFSFGPDPLGGGWRMSSEKLAQRGHAAVAVYLDENGDGRRSAGEEALPEVGVTAGRSGSGEPTDARGYTFVEGLQPYEKVLLSIDESTLPDPFLTPRGRGVVVTPRPGVAAVVELAVAPTGEVEGVLYGPEGTPLAGAGLELVDSSGQAVARAMTEYDGFFLFDRVVYGRYRLQLSPEAQAALGVAPDLATQVELGPEKTVERLGTIRLRAATTIAQVRGPPEAQAP
jgi:hypothetical protein